MILGVVLMILFFVIDFLPINQFGSFLDLIGVIIPFGGIIFPLILTWKTKDIPNKKLGKSIVEIQIILTAILSVVLMIIPFIQKNISLKFPLFMVAIVAFLLLKLVIVIVNGISLNKNSNLLIRLKTNFL